MRLNNLDFFSFSFILACANLTVVPISFQRLIKLLFSSPAILLFVALEQELQVLASVVYLIFLAMPLCYSWKTQS